jgi:hypothetical protein
MSLRRGDPGKVSGGGLFPIDLAATLTEKDSSGQHHEQVRAR